VKDSLRAVRPRQASSHKADSVNGVNNVNRETHDDAGITRSPQFIPWVVVAVVAVIAIVAALFFVNSASGEPEPTPEPTPTAQPTTTPTPSPTPKPTVPDETPSKDPAPSVDVGNTSTMQIGQWNATAEVSGRFGALNYMITGEKMLITSALTDSFPASCGDAMRTGWGVARVGDQTYQVVKPASKCADSPELFDQVWGLTQAMADSIKPA
jgi:hypothetical protein